MDLYDPARGRYVNDGPEERVRQAVVRTLVEQHGVPLHLVETEFPLSRVSRGRRGRVDVLVHDFRRKKALLYPWLLIECKRESVGEQELNDQIRRYLQVFTPAHLAVVEGDLWRVFELRTEQSRYEPLARLPRFPELSEIL